MMYRFIHGMSIVGGAVMIERGLQPVLRDGHCTWFGLGIFLVVMPFYQLLSDTLWRK